MARNSKENMNNSDGWWRGDTKSKSRQEGGEGADRQGEKENEGGSGANDWKTGAQLSLLDSNARRPRGKWTITRSPGSSSRGTGEE